MVQTIVTIAYLHAQYVSYDDFDATVFSWTRVLSTSSLAAITFCLSNVTQQSADKTWGARISAHFPQ